LCGGDQIARVTAQAIRQFLQVQQFAKVTASAAMNICFNSDKKIPLTLNQTSRRPKKMVNAPSAERKKTCVRKDNGLRSAKPNSPPIKMPIALRNAPVTR
jgi:hypothetical protein